ncbi:hypothetical protein H0H93_012357, partial [Arthromyces matolae]
RWKARISNFWGDPMNLGLEDLENDFQSQEPSCDCEGIAHLIDDALCGLKAINRFDNSGIKVNAIKPVKKPDEQGRPMIERNASIPRDPSRMIPDPVVVEVEIDGHPVRALLDSGSLGDFVSTTLVGQLKLKKKDLISPLNVQMAAQGSRSKINYHVEAKLKYQGISENRSFDVMNLSGYDAILGTPWFYQHRVLVGLNPARVMIGSDEALPLKGSGVQKLASRTMKIYEEKLEEVQSVGGPATSPTSHKPRNPVDRRRQDI